MSIPQPGQTACHGISSFGGVSADQKGSPHYSWPQDILPCIGHPDSGSRMGPRESFAGPGLQQPVSMRLLKGSPNPRSARKAASLQTRLSMRDRVDRVDDEPGEIARSGVTFLCLCWIPFSLSISSSVSFSVETNIQGYLLDRSRTTIPQREVWTEICDNHHNG